MKFKLKLKGAGRVRGKEGREREKRTGIGGRGGRRRRMGIAYLLFRLKVALHTIDLQVQLPRMGTRH